VARKAKTQTIPSEAPDTVQGMYWLPADAKWGGFINIRLPDDAKLAFNAWQEDFPSAGPEILDELLGEGVKVGLSYDRENECYICTLTGALVSGSNERYCCTSRASRLAEVINLAAWKHAYYAQGDYGSYKPSDKKLASWG